MKSRLTLFALTAALASVLVLQGKFALAFLALFAVSALASSPRSALAMMPTLTTAEIVADLFAAFRKMVPAVRYMATDFSSQTVKKGQQIIAHVGALPTAVDHNDAAGYFNSPANARDLLTDVPVTMDTHKDVILKLQGTDLNSDRSTKYVEAVNSSAYVLGKAFVDSILGKANSTNLSNVATCAGARAPAAKLRSFTSQLNTQGAGPMRYGLTSSGFMTGLLSDTVIGSADYFDQRQDAGPFAILNNIAGFQQIAEYPDFPENNGNIATFTANASTEVITTASAHGLVVGDRVRVSNSGGALPAGLAAATNYFVISVPTSTTLTVSATAGGSAVNITDTGSGTHTLQRFDNLTGLFFEKRAIVAASRLPSDSIALAQSRGVPIPMKAEPVTDPETGLTVLCLERFNTGTLDLELCFSVIFGSAIGRQGGSAGAIMDNGALRVIKA